MKLEEFPNNKEFPMKVGYFPLSALSLLLDIKSKYLDDYKSLFEYYYPLERTFTPQNNQSYFPSIKTELKGYIAKDIKVAFKRLPNA